MKERIKYTVPTVQALVLQPEGTLLNLSNYGGESVSGASAIGFWLNHWETYSTAGNAYEACAVSVDQIEAWTGFDFFSNLSTSLQSGAEVATDWAAFKAY